MSDLFSLSDIKIEEEIKDSSQSNLLINHPIWKDIERYWDHDFNVVNSNEITVGSHTKFYLKCKNNHSSSINAPGVIRIGYFKCKSCSKLPYTHSEYIKYWDSEKNKKDISEVGSGAGNSWWICDEGHSYEMAVSNKIRTRPENCPICNGRGLKQPKENLLNTIYPNFKELYSKSNTLKFERIPINRGLPLIWDFKCSHSYKTSVKQMIKHNGTCKYCENREFLQGFNSIDKTHPFIINEWSNKNAKNISEYFCRSNDNAWFTCPDCTHEFYTRINRRVFRTTQCPVCCGNVIKEGVNDLTTFAPQLVDLIDEEKTNKKITEIGKSHEVYIKCFEGNHSYKANMRAFRKGLAPCRICHPRSKVQDELTEYITEILPNNILMRDIRTIIRPLELDIWIPELNVGIEFNGDYYHSDKYIKETKGITALEYHTLKLNKAREKNIELLFIWESDWRNNQILVKSELKNYLVNKCPLNKSLFHKLSLT